MFPLSATDSKRQPLSTPLLTDASPSHLLGVKSNLRCAVISGSSDVQRCHRVGRVARNHRGLAGMSHPPAWKHVTGAQGMEFDESCQQVLGKTIVEGGTIFILTLPK